MKRFLMFALCALVSTAALAPSPVLAAEDGWREALVCKWTGIPQVISNRTPRELTLKKIHEDGRVEGTYWGPTLGSAAALRLSPKSRAAKKGEYIVLDLRVEEGLPLDLELAYHKGSLSGNLIPKMGPGLGEQFFIYFQREC